MEPWSRRYTSLAAEAQRVRELLLKLPHGKVPWPKESGSQARAGNGADAEAPDHVAGQMELVLAEPEDYRRAIDEVLAIARDTYGAAVIVSCTVPYPSLSQRINEAGMGKSPVRVVDLLSQLDGMPPEDDTGNISYLASPTLLEQAMKMTLEAVGRMRSNPCVVVDSLSSLSFYNAPNLVIQFTHRLVSRLRTMGVGSVFLAIENQGSSAYVDDVIPLFDSVSRPGPGPVAPPPRQETKD